MALPASLLGLMDADTYPHACERIELIETHISWVLLTGNFAYKLKKPVRFSFLDFSTLELREHFCREELRCNRAFAPDLYLAVTPIYQHTNGHIELGDDTGGTLLEWAVKMRQFKQADQLDRLLLNGEVTTNMLTGFGSELASLHAALPSLKDATRQTELRNCGPVTDNFDEIAATSLQSAYERLLTATREPSQKLGTRLLPLLEERARNGFVRECHGDLHLSNLALIDGKVTAFDCLEFNPNLRWIDTVSDMAFLFMDCHERGRSDLAYAFLDGYLDTSGDYMGTELLGYFAAYRSMVRAKVAALRWEQSQSEESERRFVNHTEWAKQWLTRPCGKLILMCGLSGAGKSTVAERLVPLLHAIRLRSDVARKSLAGLPSLAHTDSAPEGGLYQPGRSDEVFDYLLTVTETLLLDGENVIVDATFIERTRRLPFLALAERLNTIAHIIYCHAPAELLRERIRTRARSEADASEATLEVLDLQIDKFEPPDAAEPVIEFPTDTPLSDAALKTLVLRTS